MTVEPDEAEPWLHGAEGVIAKELDAPYRPGERTGMVKVKRVRTIDAVVRGWRPGKEEGTVGSLILALYDGDQLREVGGRDHAQGAVLGEADAGADAPRSRQQHDADPEGGRADPDREALRALGLL